MKLYLTAIICTMLLIFITFQFSKKQSLVQQPLYVNSIMNSFIHVQKSFFLMMLLLILSNDVASSEPDPYLVSTMTGNQDPDLCSVYPPCADYGEGSHEILEDCRRYIQCELNVDGSFNQRNMICPENLVFTNKQGRCVNPDKATECKEFQNLKCKEECPRIHFSSPPQSGLL